MDSGAAGSSEQSAAERRLQATTRRQQRRRIRDSKTSDDGSQRSRKRSAETAATVDSDARSVEPTMEAQMWDMQVQNAFLRHQLAVSEQKRAWFVDKLHDAQTRLASCKRVPSQMAYAPVEPACDPETSLQEAGRGNYAIQESRNSSSSHRSEAEAVQWEDFKAPSEDFTDMLGMSMGHSGTDSPQEPEPNYYYPSAPTNDQYPADAPQPEAYTNGQYIAPQKHEEFPVAQQGLSPTSEHFDFYQLDLLPDVPDGLESVDALTAHIPLGI